MRPSRTALTSPIPFAIVPSFWPSMVAAGLIAAAPASAHVTLLSPNGGETFANDAPIHFEWQTVIGHDQENWDLWYSTESATGGWVGIAMDLPVGDPTSGSLHSYDWTPTGLVADDVWVRVRQDNRITSYLDVSDASFAIVPSPATVAALAGVSLLADRRRRA